MTRQQSESRLWFRMRTGLVTASRFKAASRTCPDSPSKSLILSICHPELGKFSTAATRWGCHHEKQARDAYESFQRTKHEAFKVEESGFFINVDHGFIGASPDGLVNCKCCGNGVCEIKCPYCHKDDTLDTSLADKDFCLEETPVGKRLKRKHCYYYQVQAQLFCSARSYCDFVVWSEKMLYIERILPDEKFWKENISRVEKFIIKGILPELLGKFYSHTSGKRIRLNV
ncbi:uncharacterized protein LOC124447974 [Xenia sp. Carnegie-2017]|uniref:uncharacterized protein LOC124447974 n=1 Tax=Xenia sp. Carnegie-2017 TaxID=2897299 RepID=UPI001F03871C|nr:uncharacterized protein LOC124447974 [Xenia sp. Carnegie-2017]